MQSEVIHEDDYVYLGVERKHRKAHRHKLALIAEDPYKEPKVDSNTGRYWEDGPVPRECITIESRILSEVSNEETCRVNN